MAKWRRAMLAAHRGRAMAMEEGPWRDTSEEMAMVAVQQRATVEEFGGGCWQLCASKGAEKMHSGDEI